MSRVVVSIVAWNSMQHLPETLAAFAKQTFERRTMIIVDNASTDGMEDFVRANYPGVAIIRNTKNLGFAHAHNQAIAYAMAHLRTEGEETYMLIANPDVVPESDCLARMAEAMDAHPEAGSVGPKLLKMRVAASEDSFNGDARDTDRMSADELVREGKRTTVLDSAGLRMYRSRRIVDRGAGEEDGHYDRPEEVFGVSAALALYRLSALEDAAYRGQYFDDQFFAYKEDIDLAWRLRLLGWKAFYVPSGRAYHYRTAAGADSMSLRVLHGVRRDRSEFVKYLSYRNHLFLLAKNDHAINMIRYAARMGCYEFGKLVYACCFEPRTVRALPAFLRGLPAVLAKRRDVMRRARVKAGDIRTWLA